MTPAPTARQILDRQRRLASALRSAERGWDWRVVDTPDGPVVDAVTVSIEEAGKDSRRLILDLLEMQRATQASRTAATAHDPRNRSNQEEGKR